MKLLNWNLWVLGIFIALFAILFAIFQYFNKPGKLKIDVLKKSISWAIIVIIPIWFYGYFLYVTDDMEFDIKSDKYHSFSDSTFNVLILPFEPLEDCTFKITKIERTIEKRLTELSESKHLKLSVKFDSTQNCPLSFDEGRKIGEKLKADLIIWGDFYEQCYTDTSIACLKYYILNELDYPINTYGQTELARIPSMVHIKSGYLSKDVDYIIYWTQGIESLNKNDFKTALKYFNQIKFEVSEKYIGLLLNKATCYFYLDNFDSSLASLKLVLQINDKIESAHFNIAKILMDVYHDYSNSNVSFKKAIKINPRFEEAYIEYAYLLYKYYNKPQLARKQLEIALKINPKSIAANNNLAILLETHFKDYESARSYYVKVLGIEPNFPQAHNNLAILLANSFNEINEAEKHFLVSLKIDQNNSNTKINYAEFLIKNKKDYKLSISNLFSALEMNPSKLDSARALNLIGVVYSQSESDQELAEKYFFAALAVDPDYAIAHTNIGNLFRKDCWKPNEAFTHIKKALHIDKNIFEAHYNMAMLQKNCFKNYKQAIIYFENCIELKQNHVPVLLSLAMLYHFDLKQYQLAISRYNKVIELQPRHIDAIQNLAYVYGDIGDYENSSKFFELALKVDEKNFETHFNYAYFLLNYREEILTAKKHYLRACDLNPSIKNSERDKLFDVK